MSNLRHEFHVAQQFRRDKLRIQNSDTNNPQHLEDYFPNNLEQLSLHQQVRDSANNMFDNLPQPQLQLQALYSSSEIMSLSSASTPTILPDSSSSKEQCGNWRNSSVPHGWMVNYATSSVANDELNNNSSNNNNNVVVTDEMHYPNSVSSNSSSLYQNALQDIFNKASSSVICGHGSEMASLMHQNQTSHGNWGSNNNSQNYGGISANLWINRGGIDNDDNTLGWNNNNSSSSSPLGLGLTDKKVMNDSYSNPHNQGLSLSLSSNSSQQSKPCGGEGSLSNDPQSGTNSNSSNILKSAMMKPSTNVVTGKLIQDSMGLPSPNTNICYRNVGPLGPFTGYATILKSSRFLKPCQQLLDEYCCQQSGDVAAADWVSREHVSAASTSSAVNVLDESTAGGGGSNSMLYGSNKGNSINDGGAAASNFCASSSSYSRPECQKNKAKLVYMQDEVTRRYKQYHQQMQMVVSSFESVAGLNSATPYISLALKSVSRHFRCLKNAISDQLKLICEALGEDFSMPTTSPSSSKFDTSNISRLRCMEQSFQRNKSGNMDFIEHQQQHAWRPQRGLPERSVAILKAWLFEHFLHPYPTDTDKHMLATQTGLSRNQISNWFINARVRLWKPMVEEIHMLETKGMVGDANQSSGKNEGINSSSDGGTTTTSHHHPRVVDHQHFNMFGATHVINAIPERQFHGLEMGPSSSSMASANEEEQWNQEKRSKLECHQITSGMDHGTLIGLMPYRRAAGGGVEGLGQVSLTLGLMHGVEGPQHHHQQQQQLQLRRHFGGHMIHDFVG